MFTIGFAMLRGLGAPPFWPAARPFLVTEKIAKKRSKISQIRLKFAPSFALKSDPCIRAHMAAGGSSSSNAQPENLMKGLQLDKKSLNSSQEVGNGRMEIDMRNEASVLNFTSVH